MTDNRNIAASAREDALSSPPPHLSNPPILPLLSSLLHTHQAEIEAWFAEQYRRTYPLFYTSVDIRYSGHKIAPVDTNIFPAGFNLLSPDAREHASAAMRRYFSRHFPRALKLLLIPEDHTRNTYYLENVATLKTLLDAAGMAVESASFASGELRREGDTLRTASGFTPDVVLMNNDLSSGVPKLLPGLAQPVIPPPGLGWHRRRKTAHFDTYNELARKFGQAFGLDPWLISTLFSHCGQINFREQLGLECVAQNVERCLQQIRKKYEEYGITDTPYVFIKADRGTYGMGIMTVRSPEEVLEINKKNRHKMDVIKEGVTNSEVIIQEGVPTIDVVHGKVAEPLMYLVGGEVVGCTWRINENRDAFSNLNAPGMTFDNACSTDGDAPATEEPLCPVRGLIAQLSTLAAAQECYEPGWEI